MSNEGIAYIKKEFQLEKIVSNDVDHPENGASVKPNTTEDDEDDATEDQEKTLNGADSSSKSKKRKKLTGRNKGPRGKKHIFDVIVICSKVAAGEECPYGESCRYSHDLQAFLATKPPDIGNVCPEFELYGHCGYGYKCRFLNAHITSDGKLITRNMDTVSPTLNILKKDTQQKLRTAKYDTPLSDIYIEKMKALADIQKKHNEEAHQRKLVASIEGVLFNPQRKEEIIESIENEGDQQNGYDVEEDEERNIGPVVVARDGKKTVDFRDKLYLAPLTTVGNLPFRRICKEFGADITCGEMAMAVNLLQGQQSEWALMKRHVSEDIFGVQICGNKPDIVTKTAEILNKEIQVDFVDLNCGCPIDLVYRKGAGSALLDSSSRLSKIIRGMDQVLDCPVTVKLRTGTKENVLLAHKLLPKFETWGVGLSILHGRSRQQRYTKLAKWNYIAECKKVVKEMAFFGNGDILSYEDYYTNKDQSDVDGIMIGRGALMKPWLFDEIKTRRHWDISSTERLEILKKFCNYGLEHWGSDTQGVNTTRRFFCEWQSFLYRYIPVGLLEVIPQKMNQRPVPYFGRNDLETLMASNKSSDWVKLSEMFLGPTPEDFHFIPKHKSNSYEGEG